MSNSLAEPMQSDGICLLRRKDNRKAVRCIDSACYGSAKDQLRRDVHLPTCRSCERQLKPVHILGITTHRQYPASVSEPPRRDLATRAVEVFFTEWIAFPAGLGSACPGYLHYTPALYHDDSVHPLLKEAVHALAFANRAGALDSNGREFALRARTCYGKVLQHLSSLAKQSASDTLASDDVIAAVLLIDQWELMHLGRSKIQNCHGNLLSHIIFLRQKDQVGSQASATWLIAAAYRVMLQCILVGEKPRPEQREYLSELDNTIGFTVPWVRIMLDTWDIGILSAEARRLVAEDIRNLDAQVIATLIDRSHTFLQRASAWQDEVSDLWRPEFHNRCQSRSDTTPHEGIPDSASLRSSDRCISVFKEPWIAEMWTSYWSCLLILQDRLITLMTHVKRLDQWCHRLAERWAVEEEYANVHQLEGKIAQAMPSALGQVRHSSDTRDSRNERPVMLQRLFALFPLSVVADVSCTSPKYKTAAAEMKSQLQLAHALD